MCFVDKKILVLCKETYSYPLYFLAQKWMKNNRVSAFFFNPCESMYKECSINDTTYYAFKKISGITVYTSNDISEYFSHILDSDIIDEKYLNYIQERYTHFENLNSQILATQFFTRHYHYRNYMKSCSYNQQLNWLILNYKNINNIVDDFKPDVVIDTDNAELARCVMREVCYERDIPYITIEYPRYSFYKSFSFNLNLSVDPIFVESYQSNLNKGTQELAAEISYVRDFRSKVSIMHEMYKNDVTSQYKPNSFMKLVRTLVGKISYFWEQDIKAGNLKLKRSNPILYNNSVEYLKFYAKYELIKQYLLRKNKYFYTPSKGEKYLYMPLHLIPESTTFTLAPHYINELTIIEAVSKSLPAGWWLYVKEHQAMVGERGLGFYQKVNKLPNVKMVQLNYYSDPKPWIVNSMGVITISGTTAYEAALLQRHAIIFSDVPFKLLDGVERCRSFEDLPELIRNFSTTLDNEKSCAAYIATVKQLGFSIDLKYLMNQGEKIIRNKSQQDSRYQENLNNLEQLYLLAFSLYKRVVCQK
jgi:hypothetical protein